MAALTGKDVIPIQEQHVEVDVEVQGAAETLDQGHGAGVGQRASVSGLADQWPAGTSLPMAISPSGIHLLKEKTVFTFDFDLNPLWQHEVEGGRGPLSGIRSLITAGDCLFTVSQRDHEIVAQSRESGHEVWRSEKLHSAWALQASGKLMVLFGAEGGLTGWNCGTESINAMPSYRISTSPVIIDSYKQVTSIGNHVSAHIVRG